MRMQLGLWRRSLGTGLAVLVGVVVTACCPKGPGAPEPVQGCPPGRAPQTQAELDKCLQKVAFDTNYEAIDEQPLAIITPSQGERCPGSTADTPRCRYGPLAKIQPVIGAHRYSEEDLREGRIIAKISLAESERQGYPKYGLAPGQVTYWWVRTDASGRAGKSVFVTTTGRAQLDTIPRPLIRVPDDDSQYKGRDPRVAAPVFQYPHPDTSSQELPDLRRAIVRWIWSLEDETASGKCGAGSCR